MPFVPVLMVVRSAGTQDDNLKEALMRKTLFWSGLVVLMVLPFVYGVQIYITQDLPSVQVWQWMIPAAAVVMVFFSRNPDDVLKHHVVS
jgi:cobalamin biosynthesis protein CobD/CbiB